MIEKILINYRKLFFLLLIFPGLTLLIFVFITPLSKIILHSFYTRNIEATYEEIFTINNYISFFGTNLYCSILFRTFRIAFYATVCCLILGYPLAYMISKHEKNLSFFLYFLILLSLFVNELIRSYAWMVMFQSRGLFNQILFNIGILSSPIRFLGTEFGVIIGMVHILLPFMILPIYNNIIKIDENYILAAKSLGASPLKIFIFITLPLNISGILTGFILSFIVAIGLYITPSLLGGPKVMVMSSLITQQMLNILNWPFATASSCILLFFISIIIFLFRKILKFDNMVD